MVLGAAPLVSVLVPVRDAGRTLPLALESIARQTERDFECLVVDDGSTDDSVEIVRRRAASDPRFVSIERPPQGVASALNAGLDRARGRYVARMDADDWMHRRRIELQVRALRADARLAAVGGHVRIFPRAGLTDGILAYERWLNSMRSFADVEREAFVECPVVHPTLFIRRDVIERHRYADVSWPEDYDLVLRLLAAGCRIGVVPQRILGWRDSPTRVTRTSARCGAQRIVACKARYLAQGFLAEQGHYVLWGYGDTGRVLCRALAEHGKHPSEIVERHPRRIGQRISGARVIHPRELSGVRGSKIVVSVAGPAARGEIREILLSEGWQEGRGFVFAA